MTNPTDRLLAAALLTAGKAVAQEQENGHLLWKHNDLRCYEAERSGDLVLTITRATEPVLQYELVGVAVGALR